LKKKANMNLPKSRTNDIVVQNLSNEVLIYDLLTNQAFGLNETATVVFNSCNGRTSLSKLKEEARLTDEMIFLALEELKRFGLIEQGSDFSSPFDGMSRREIIRKVGLSSLIAMPVISSLIAPTAAQAQSLTNFFTCSNPGAAIGNFCASSPSGCNTQAKTLCATCGATASSGGICSANPPGTAQVTCSCGGACSNPGAQTGSFCATPAQGCSAASTFCASCSATGSSSGVCSPNGPGGSNFTCTCL
jgi:hypothetical protein